MRIVSRRSQVSLGCREGMGKASWKRCSGRKDKSEEKRALGKGQGAETGVFGEHSRPASCLGRVD